MKTTGVYILKREGVPVYVGKSLAVERRTRCHTNKKFDSVEVLPMARNEISKTEIDLIKKHLPEYNILHARRRKHASQRCVARGVSLPPELEQAAIKKACRMDVSFSKYVQRLVRMDIERGLLKA